MNNLFDTCTIKHKICSIQNLENVVKKCNKKDANIIIEKYILMELKPPNCKPDDIDEQCYETGKTLYNYINLLIKSNHIKTLDHTTNMEISSNLTSIRKRYYQWMEDPRYCKYLIKNHMLSEEEYYSPRFRKKDYGECVLLAIATTNKSKHIIITEDKGRVYKHPNINLFDEFIKQGYCILNYDQWMKGYII